jgi:dipeptidyl aminopeptidase/acylaminoacyl peptidase
MDGGVMKRMVIICVGSLGLLHPATRTAHGQEPGLVQLTTFPSYETTPAWSPDGTQLAIQILVGSTSSIMVIPDTGGYGTPIVPGTSLNGYPSWSPDGSQIAFQSNRSGGGTVTIWTVAASGGTATQLTFGPQEWDPSWSPDGTWIAFRSGNISTSIEVVPAEGGTPMPLLCCGGMAPSWSPDGTRIAFHTRGIYVMPDTGGTATQLTFDSSDRYPAWSPDGSQIVFESTRSGNSDLWVVPATGGEVVQLTFDPASDRFPSWSPDGTRIAFASDRGGTQDIWALVFSPVSVETSTWGRMKARYQKSER